MVPMTYARCDVHRIELGKNEECPECLAERRSSDTCPSACSACAKWAKDNLLLSNALGSAIWYIREMHAKGFLTGGQPFLTDLETVHRKNGQGGGI